MRVDEDSLVLVTSHTAKSRRRLMRLRGSTLSATILYSAYLDHWPGLTGK